MYSDDVTHYNKQTNKQCIAGLFPPDGGPPQLGNSDNDVAKAQQHVGAMLALYYELQHELDVDESPEAADVLAERAFNLGVVHNILSEYVPHHYESSL